MAEKVFFIINKYSGKGFQSAIEGQIIDACNAHHIEATLEYTQRRGHATELANEAVERGFNRIFARGGDGTVNEVARALVHSPAALGILPAGSGNGLARHLRIPLNLHGALHQLDQYKVIEMDTLLINGSLSVNVSGFGFDAHVAHEFGKNGQRGLTGYARLVLGDFMSYDEFEVDAIIDGVPTRQRAFMVAIANASQFGHNALVAPEASVSDGVLDLCFIRKVPFTEAAPFIAKMFRGNIRRSRFATLMKARQFSAVLASPQPLHLDGEPSPPSNRFDVQIQPGSLRMIVPAQ